MRPRLGRHCRDVGRQLQVAKRVCQSSEFEQALTVDSMISRLFRFWSVRCHTRFRSAGHCAGPRTYAVCALNLCAC